jgi:murein hydrolase activator
VKGEAMRFWLLFFGVLLAPVMLGTALLAQNVGDEQDALRAAKAKAAAAEARSENLRQEASNASLAADRIVAQRAVLSAEIDAAAAQIEAANARIALINSRQRKQRAMLGEASEPMLRLNTALQQMTRQPTSLMMAQPGKQSDYVHLRAIMATIEPNIRARTAALRQQITIQQEMRSQEYLALQSLKDARKQLSSRKTSLARLEGSSRNRADSLSANAAIEFEQAIAQGEQARDIVERIDTMRMSGETASSLAALAGPMLRTNAARSAGNAPTQVYQLPRYDSLAAGFSELSATGYRERGVTLLVGEGEEISAPAAGKIIFAGIYRSYGRIVIIDHGSGWTTLLTNLGSLNVDKGQMVKQGTILGHAPETKPEIGVELRRNSRPMDIAAMLG